MDYVHRKDNIKEMYKEELAARLKKPVNKVTRDDLEILAKENKVLGEEMAQIKKQRTFGIGISFVASLAAAALVTFALPAVVGIITTGTVAGCMAAGTAALSSMGHGALIVKGLTAIVGYNAVKAPLHHAADAKFNLDYATTHDHIMALKKERMQGRAITAEQVMGVYVASNHELGQMIQREFGAPYDKLPQEKKQKVVAELSKFIPLEKMTQDINAGIINSTELAFAVDGQISGVQFGRPTEQKNAVEKFIDGCKKAFSPFKQQDVSGADIAAAAKAHEHKRHEEHANGQGQGKGRDPRQAKMTHVERLEVTSAQGIQQQLG